MLVLSVVVASMVLIAAPAAERLTVAAPPKLSVPRVSVPAPPLPAVTIAAAELATLTVLTVPVPSSVPWLSVTAGDTATVPAWTNFAVAPPIVMPLLALIAPVPVSESVPAETVVGPVKVLVAVSASGDIALF